MLFWQVFLLKLSIYFFVLYTYCCFNSDVPALVSMVLWLPPLSVWVCLYLFEKVFFYDLTEDLIYAIDLRFFPVLCAYSPKVCFFLVSHISFLLLLHFHILCLFGLESLLCLWVLLIYFLLDSFYWEAIHSFECSSWVTEFFNSIFILAWVFSDVYIPFLNSVLGSLTASAISISLSVFSWASLGHWSS